MGGIVLVPRAAESPSGGKICGETSIGNESFDFLPLTHKSVS